MKKNNSPVWYAVFIDDELHKNGPRALFFDYTEAIDWGRDASLFHLDVVPVEITEFILKELDEPTTDK